MRDEHIQQVTIRRLRDGDFYAAEAHILNGQLLQLHLHGDLGEVEIRAGDLVEIRSLRTLYLGEARGQQGKNVVVRIEHTLDLAMLARVQQVWHGPASE